MTILNEVLRNDPRYWFLKQAYHKLQPPYNKHFAVAVASESGGGKSYSTLSCAYANYPDLDPNESIAFDARKFLEISKGNHKTAFPLILDDAGLTAFSGDALSKEVGAISKVAQSIRHKNWQVYLNLPNLDLLAKSVRITNHYYLEPVWIDYETEECFCKFQRMHINPKGGDKLRFISPRKWITEYNEVTQYEELKKQIFHTVPVPHPPKHLAKVYDKLKEENMQKFREETRIELEKRHQAKMRIKPKQQDIIKIIKENPQNFMKDGEVSVTIVANKFDIASSTAHQIVKNVRESLQMEKGTLSSSESFLSKVKQLNEGFTSANSSQ